MRPVSLLALLLCLVLSTAVALADPAPILDSLLNGNGRDDKGHKNTIVCTTKYDNYYATVYDTILVDKVMRVMIL